MPTDIATYDISQYITGDSVQLDYGITTATGTSNYIVNNQLVSYGVPNFNADARILEVKSPSNMVVNSRSNPICNQPQIVLQNSGSNIMSTALIEYWVNEGSHSTFQWNGSLKFLEKEVLNLPVDTGLWSKVKAKGNTFYAVIKQVNGGADDYVFNDSISSNFNSSDVLPSKFLIQLQTNKAAFQNKLELRNSADSLILQKSGLSNNTIYRDTVNLSGGCYALKLTDSGNNGIDFWANNQGNGSLKIKDKSGNILKIFNPDFGGSILYNFSVNNSVGLNERNNRKFSLDLFPNPATKTLNIKMKNVNAENWSIYNALGAVVKAGNFSNGTTPYTVDLSSLQDGLYFLQIVTDGELITKRFVVSK